VTDVSDWYDDLDPSARYEPDPEDYEIAKAEREHSETVHAGGDCDCPLPTKEETEAYWAEQARLHSADTHDGFPCDCTAPF
jgi:hypothetical protein